MLRINRETDYAIRVVLALAIRPTGSIIPSAEIRKEMELPESLSLQIISRLAHLGFLNTYPGRNGGIQLARPSAEINLHQIVSAFEGPITLSECIDLDDICSLTDDCPVRKQWFLLQNVIEKELATISFEKLSQEIPTAAEQIIQSIH